MLLCPKCKVVLYPVHISHWVTCMECFHRWELNEDNTAIKSVTVKIENMTKKISASQILRGK